MKKIIGIVLLQTTLAFAQTTKIDFVAEGSATAQAEFMKLNIKLEAQCQSSAQNSRLAVEQLIKTTLEKVESHKDNTVENQMQVMTDSPTRKEIVRYLPNGQAQVICSTDKGWTTGATVIFKLTHVDHLALILDDLLSLDQVSILANQPVNRVVVAKPEPGIFSGTYDKLSDIALSKALASAQRQAQVIADQLKLAKISLSKISATRDVSGSVSYDRTSLGTDTDAMQLQSVSVQVSRNFSFVLSN